MRTWFGNFFRGVNSWMNLPTIVLKCCWAVVLLGFGYFACRIIETLRKR